MGSYRKKFRSIGGESNLPLTARQWEILDAIRKHIQKFHIVPSFREIGQAVGISSINGVRCHLDALERKGFILRRKNTSRSIVLLIDEQGQQKSIPVLGLIIERRLEKNAGQEPLNLQSQMFQWKKDYFAVHFKDESLVSEYAIHPNDYLVLRSTRSLKNGVTALLLDGSKEVYLVQCHRNRKAKCWEFYSCGPIPEKIEISNPFVYGQVITLVRFSI